ncbi:MAG: Rpn family recombination-promoting nuclease/putative transposase [Bacteroidales bacterium]|jgi:predicted transposase/invertase (TIGR01784 family)|nr:Rpn family recombination-promoting nuclease/putative transposase [Bacteroidales bacterium]
MQKDREKSAGKKERQLVSFDWAVKRLLRDRVNFEVVEGFLSELLNREVRITSVLESESNKVDAIDKHNRADIVVEDREGEIILIELQFILEIDYFQRMLFGVSKAITDGMTQGSLYRSLKKIYSINIVYFDIGHGNGYAYHGRTDFRNMYDGTDILELSEEQREIFGKIEVGDLYPEYYVLKINKFDDVAKTTLDEWIYFLKNDRIKEDFKAQGLLKAREILDYFRLSAEERAAYDYEQEAKSRYLSQIASAKYEVEWEYSKQIKEKDKTIEEKDKTIEEQSKALEEQSKALEEKIREIEEYKRLLNIN